MNNQNLVEIEFIWTEEHMPKIRGFLFLLSTLPKMRAAQMAWPLVYSTFESMTRIFSETVREREILSMEQGLPVGNKGGG